MFEQLGISGALHSKGVFLTTLSTMTCDVAYSIGLSKTFDDRRPFVRRHAELLKSSGTALILIQNYRDLYSRLHHYFAPENLTIHNLNIMTSDALKALASADMLPEVHTKRVGRIDLSQLIPNKKWPAPIAKAFHLVFNAAGIVQPFAVPALCPWIALRSVGWR